MCQYKMRQPSCQNYTTRQGDLHHDSQTSRRSLGVSRATLYRKRMGFTGKGEPSRRTKGGGSHRALSVRERNYAIEMLHSERFVDKSPSEVYAMLPDEGRYICSPQTYYRIQASERENAPRGMQAKHVKYARPELLATRPNELWSWDIPKLKGPRKWTLGSGRGFGRSWTPSLRISTGFLRRSSRTSSPPSPWWRRRRSKRRCGSLRGGVPPFHPTDPTNPLW